MPKKNAKAVIEEVRRIKPDIKILFTSGYAEDYLLTRGMIERGISLIRKPMSTNGLLQKVRTVLDS
jgi:two-component SAPR family response regulator